MGSKITRSHQAPFRLPGLGNRLHHAAVEVERDRLFKAGTQHDQPRVFEGLAVPLDTGTNRVLVLQAMLQAAPLEDTDAAMIAGCAYIQAEAMLAERAAREAR